MHQKALHQSWDHRMHHLLDLSYIIFQIFQGLSSVEIMPNPNLSNLQDISQALLIVLEHI